jgi:hypothetical protein
VNLKSALLVGLFVAGSACAATPSLAQYGRAVPPRWTYDGSAVCPNNYDYRGGMCRERGRGYGGGYGTYRGHGYGGGYAGGYGGGSESVPARWNRRGQAVCPDNFDYAGGRCVSRY